MALMNGIRWNSTDLFPVIADVFSETLENYPGYRKFGNYPPMNTYVDDEKCVMEFSLPGFKKDDIKVYTKNNVLYVSSTGPPDVKRSYVQRGIVQKSFGYRYQLKPNNEVDFVNFEDGILSISIKKNQPKEEDVVTYL